MKNQVLVSIMLSVLLFFASSGSVYVFGNGGFSSPFSNEQSFGGGFPSDGRSPSDASLERITGFGTITPFSAPPNGGGGIDVGGPGGGEDDLSNVNDAPIGGGGLIILLSIAVIHVFIVVLRRRIMRRNVLSV